MIEWLKDLSEVIRRLPGTPRAGDIVEAGLLALVFVPFVPLLIVGYAVGLVVWLVSAGLRRLRGLA